MSSIIPHNTLTEKRRWNFFPQYQENCRETIDASYMCFWFRYWWKQLHQWKVWMEAIADYYTTCDTILDAWHCPLGVDFAHAVGETAISHLHAMFAIHCSSRASSRTTLYHFKNAFLFLHMLLTRSFRWNMSTGKNASNVLNTLENTLRYGILRIGNRRRYSSTAAVALPTQKL